MRNRISHGKTVPALAAALYLTAAGTAWAGAGGTGGGGAVFSVMHTFTGADGSRPFGSLLWRQGRVFGTTSGGGPWNAGTAFQFVVSGGVYNVLHAFAGGTLDGAGPLSGLIIDSIGNLYGTTFEGGAANAGTMYKINFLGGFQLLHSFAGSPLEGSGPAGTLVMDPAGNIYGTTYTGGRSDGWGTTFEWTAAGIYFTGQSFSPDGALPRAGLVRAGAHLYGTTLGGYGDAPAGSVYEANTRPALYTFTGGADGAQPMASLIIDGLGHLLGTAMAGGSDSLGFGHGVVFQIEIATGALTVLHTFTGPDGSAPMGSLALDTSGNLYGTTMWGGAFNNGTVFRLDSSGNFTTLYSFTGGADGGNPFAGVALDTSNDLWGVTSAGGSAPAPDGDGVLFMIALAPT